MGFTLNRAASAVSDASQAASMAAKGARVQESLSLYDYGLIGNQYTGALVSRDGSIDWACFPRFDSPSVFGRLLDRRAGGFHQIVPQGGYTSHQQYVTGTNILSTLFELRRGLVLALTDFMPAGPSATTSGGEPRIIRRLIARGGPIEVTMTSDPRFDYAREQPEWATEGDLAIADAEYDRISMTSPWPWVRTDHGVTSSGTVAPTAPLYAQVRWGDPPPPDPSPATMLSVTDAYWRGWVSSEDTPLRRVSARWHPWV